MDILLNDVGTFDYLLPNYRQTCMKPLMVSYFIKKNSSVGYLFLCLSSVYCLDRTFNFGYGVGYK